MPSWSPGQTLSTSFNQSDSLNASLVPSLSPSTNLSKNLNGMPGLNPSLVPSLSPSTNPSKSPSCLSEYECIRLQRNKRNEATLAELGLLDPLAPRTKTNRRTCVVMQDDVVRQVQPKHNVKNLTSNKNLDDPVISKRTLTWERRTLSAREYVTLNTRMWWSTSPAAPIVTTRTTRTS